MPPSGLRRYGPIVAVAVILVLVAALRLLLASAPLERDEGEYALAGQLILHGVPPYALAYNMKFPGTYYAFSLILATCGQTAWGIHVGLLGLNAATALVLFLLGRRLIGDIPAVIATIGFDILSFDRAVMGPFAHATHFVLLPALAGLLMLLAAGRSTAATRLLLSGVLLGISVLMKQQAVFLLPFAAGFLWWSDHSAGRGGRASWTRIAWLAAGAVVPFALLCGLFVAQGVFRPFWFWTFGYASQYVSEVSLADAWPSLTRAWQAITTHTILFWFLGLAGGVAVWLGRWPSETRVFLTGLLAASFLCVCPGFYFREHYFIVMFPAVALLSAVMIATVEGGLASLIANGAASVLALTLFAGVVGAYAYQERDFLFSMSPRELSRAIYGGNPFVEAPEIARYIKDRTSESDRIGVLGSEPEIYFYADRRPATGYIYTYALMEPQAYATWMQGEMRREIERAHPKYLVDTRIGSSWQLRADSDRGILIWMQQYLTQCYDLVGLADIYSLERSEILWEGQILGYQPRSGNLLLTFRQKSEAPCVVR